MANGKPRLDVLIVAYQAAAFIERCIATLIDHTHATDLAIYLIDNGTDGSGDLVARRFPQVTVIPSQGNIGFGPACNRLAEASSGDRLLLLNPDTYLDSPAIDALMAFAERTPQAWAWGGRTRLPDGTLDAGNRLVIPTLPRIARAALGQGDALSDGGLPAGATQPGPVEVLVGGFMIVDRAAWRRLGGFDESFFLYSEEIDFFARLKAAGGQAWVTPDSAIVHDVGGGAPASPSRLMYRTIGQMHFVRKHWHPLAQLAAGGLIWLGAAIRLGVGLLRRRRSPRAAANALAWRPIVTHPSRWWRGYPAGPPR